LDTFTKISWGKGHKSGTNQEKNRQTLKHKNDHLEQTSTGHHQEKHLALALSVAVHLDPQR